MSIKRVLFIGHTYTTPVNRRKFKYVAKDHRFELLLVTPRKWRNQFTVTDNIRFPGKTFCRTFFVDVWFGQHHVLYFIPTLGKIIKEFQPHLIYCEQEPICLVSLQAALLAQKIPLVFYSWENIRRSDLKYQLFSPVRSICFHRSTFMVAGSWEVTAVMRSQGYTKPIYITPHLGVSEELFFPANPTLKEDKSVLKEFVIGYLGRFAQQKDVGTLLQAVSLINRTIRWRLVLVGAGFLLKNYQTLADHYGIADRVSFHQAVPHDEVPHILREFDVLVLPSKTTPTWKEQFGHVLIEAMACGIPVVGSSSGQIPLTIGNAGLVFQEQNPRDLQEKLLLLYENIDLRNDFKKRGITRVKQYCTDKQIAANTIHLFEKALHMAPSQPNTLQVDPGR